MRDEAKVLSDYKYYSVSSVCSKFAHCQLYVHGKTKHAMDEYLLYVKVGRQDNDLSVGSMTRHTIIILGQDHI